MKWRGNGAAAHIILIETLGVRAANADFEEEASLHVVGDLGVALEAEAGASVVVGVDTSVRFNSVVPPDERLVDLAGDFELNLAVALAGGGRLELGDALFEIAAAIAAQIGGLGRGAGPQHQSACDEDGCPSRLTYSPEHIHYSHEGTPQLGLRSTQLHSNYKRIRTYADHAAQPCTAVFPAGGLRWH